MASVGQAVSLPAQVSIARQAGLIIDRMSITNYVGEGSAGNSACIRQHCYDGNRGVLWTHKEVIENLFRK